MSAGTAVEPVVGLALGSGSARGWSHIGVIRALREAGVHPRLIAGSSIGAFVGAAYASGDLDKLENWVRGLEWRSVLGLLDLSFAGGLVKGEKLMSFFADHFVDQDFSALDLPLACVATDLSTGREVWLREGSVATAVRASIAIPGLLTPVDHDDRLLVDGGLVNPVPVSLCRAMGADVVIAVDLSSDLVGHALRRPRANDIPQQADAEQMAEIDTGGAFARWRRSRKQRAESLPSLIGVLTTSIQIMETRIARSRLAGEPADVMLTPRLGHLALMHYHRAAEAIDEGRAAVERMLPAIRHAVQP